MMKIDDIKTIAKLKLEKRYDDIYKQYGREVYLITVSDKYKYTDIRNLLDHGRYLELYEKYGEEIYKKYMKQMRKKDVENELGIHFGFINYLFLENLKGTFSVLRNKAIKVGAGVAITCGYVAAVLSSSYDDIIEENSVTYSEEINEYDIEIKKYADYINSLNLSDLEIIMKVMNDMWSNIDGYKNPGEYDAIGYHRLALYMDGYGVCRNMADDFTARMNAINADYEACNMFVYLNDAEINDIQRTILTENDTITENSDTDNQKEDSSNKENSSDIEDSSNVDYETEFIKNTTGNHMVSCVKLKDEDILLIVDPTNPSIGVLKNGQIYIYAIK